MELALSFADLMSVQGNRTLCRGPHLEDKILDGDMAVSAGISLRWHR